MTPFQAPFLPGGRCENLPKTFSGVRRLGTESFGVLGSLCPLNQLVIRENSLPWCTLFKISALLPISIPCVVGPPDEERATRSITGLVNGCGLFILSGLGMVSGRSGSVENTIASGQANSLNLFSSNNFDARVSSAL